MTTSATNIDATAVNTIRWLSATDATIVVPVYQRQYRWDIGGCEQLLADIRAVADSDGQHMHFLGSVLSSLTSDAPAPELVLIDGQQRVTTLMLLVAALHHTIRATDPRLAGELERVLVRSNEPGRTKLQPHREWERVFERVVLGTDLAEGESRQSRFDDNYAFFRSQISADEAPRIWRGLQKLEHVAITLGPGANAQQIFASLNSTGEPLRDHELIHNYVLMGLTHAEQSEIEDVFWLPIERNTGDAIGEFWRHYLVMKTGREVSGEHAAYDAFRALFPRLDIDSLRLYAAQWRDFSAIYRILLDPPQAADPRLGRHLAYTATFGTGMFPLVMRVMRDLEQGVLQTDAAIGTLEMIQALLLRRAVSGLGNARLVARLCRARDDGHEALVAAVSRVTPSDERVRIALKFGELPHARYVLERIADVDPGVDHDLLHVFPLAPPDTWTGDGMRTWAEYSEDEQNSHRALAPTLGNLVVLEPELAERALDASFPDQRDVYRRSSVAATRAIADVETWNTAAISQRSAELTGRFVEVWPRPGAAAIDDDGLTPILDAISRRGWPRGWEREYEYTEYRGEHWEIYNIRDLFNRVFRRLWADSRGAVEEFSAQRGGPVYPARAWNGDWDELAGGAHLYMGWDARYMLSAVQGVLEHAGHAPEVFVKYSYVAAHM
ncbi:DUF262 domain-containing protein [Microbacterium sp. LRZ72]|uniref:DUF262 domain-containing protein n=1 Tax=Microbacterium sp. LRZ72 TaxID=2942481 RepID=UPI0029B5506E|nr:DUF262 domain-containing protein [Microbacterium sp. LRZ72]MDX2375445.1 DUF262 domain-containing protein [Microbacterium sp. LRZ72]